MRAGARQIVYITETGVSGTGECARAEAARPAACQQQSCATHLWRSEIPRQEGWQAAVPRAECRQEMRGR